jgi:hypothetical protein
METLLEEVPSTALNYMRFRVRSRRKDDTQKRSKVWHNHMAEGKLFGAADNGKPRKRREDAVRDIWAKCLATPVYNDGK